MRAPSSQILKQNKIYEIIYNREDLSMEYQIDKNVILYQSWIIHLLETAEDDEEEAREMLWNIMLEASGIGMTTEDKRMRREIKNFIMPNIKAAQDRYENAKKGGAPKKYVDMARVHSLIDEGKTYKEIGAEFGVSDKTIQNRLREEEAEKTEETGRNRKIPGYIQDKDIDFNLDTDLEEEEKKDKLNPKELPIVPQGIKYNPMPHKRYGF